MDIEELSKKIDEYHEEDKKRADQKWWINVGLMSAGFSLAIFNTWLNSNNQRCINLVFAVVLFVIGIGACWNSSNFKEK